jgi:hypothetical protein
MRDDKIVEWVVDKFEQRSRTGIEKYGTTLHDNPLPLGRWLTHLQEELMDATLYVERLRSELEQNPKFPDGHVITKESWSSADKITHKGHVYVRFTDLMYYN